MGRYYIVVGCLLASSCATPPEEVDASVPCEPWILGGFTGSEMRPGEPCLSCHAADAFDAKPLSVAGTVFDDLRTESYCRGSGDVRIRVVDALDRELGARSGPSGNFYVEAELIPPLRAGVVLDDGSVRWMIEPVDDGDCNACHTPEGELGAPGRITP